MQLARQIHLTLLTVVIFAVIAFGALVLITSERLEHSLLDTLIMSEADLLTDRVEADPSASLPAQQMTAAWYSGNGTDTTPAPLRELGPGTVHNVAMGGRHYHVLRRPVGDGILTVAVDIEALERRESALKFAVVSGGLALIALLLAVSRAMSRRVAAPLQQLAARLDQLNPEATDPPALAGRFRGAEVEVIAEALDRYIRRLSQLVERERGFASSASHELRSPVTVLRSGLELMLMDDQLPKSLRPVAQRAHRSAERLTQVLDGLMLLARDRDGDSVAKVDARAVIGELAQEHDTGLLQFDSPDAPVPLLAHEAHLRMLVSNLIRNALEHAPGQPVRMHLDTQGLEVEDHGPGIAEELLPHIFERNRRGMESGGAGLGLYIAAEICQRHGWTITARNIAPQGCRISVHFAGAAAEATQTRD